MSAAQNVELAEQPLVSIYIPTKNRPALLQRAVQSCVTQSYSQLDIIIVDDGSAAEHQQAITAIAASDPRIRLLHNTVSQGAPLSRNKAIFAAQGTYITGLDDDDEFTPDRIAGFMAQRHLLARYALLCSGYRVQQQQGSYTYAGKAASFNLQQLLYANYIGSQVFTLTARLQQIGGFDPELKSCQDYDTWLRLMQTFGAAYRLAATSYVLYQDHAQGRITDSPAVAAGYQTFIQKHRLLMSDTQYRTQCLNWQLLHGKPTLRQISGLPLSQQWRFFKVLAARWLNTVKQGINS